MYWNNTRKNSKKRPKIRPWFAISLRHTYRLRFGYQINLRDGEQEKVPFFTPNSKNKAFKVIYFGSKNTQVFYTVMIQFLHYNYTLIFYDTINFVVDILKV